MTNERDHLLLEIKQLKHEKKELIKRWDSLFKYHDELSKQIIGTHISDIDLINALKDRLKKYRGLINKFDSTLKINKK